MGLREFDEFVNRQQTTEPPIDWNAEKAEWLLNLNDLYEKITTFLQKYIDSGSAKIRFQEIQLEEENLGSYAARKMLVSIGKQHISLVPVGTFLIGSRGRVDVEGPVGRASLLLVDKDAKDASSVIRTQGEKLPPEPERSPVWMWKLVRRTPRIAFADLSQDAFFQLIMEITNG